MKIQRTTTLLALLLSTSFAGSGCWLQEALAKSGVTTETAAKPAAPETPSAPAVAAAVAPTQAHDLKSILADASDAKGLLSNADVDLGGIDASEAPVIGGAGAPPPVAHDGGKVEWLKASGISVLNPGWKKIKGDGFGVLVSPSEKAGMVFAPVTNVDEALDKVVKIAKVAKMTDVQWKPTKVLRIGPDKLPAKVGMGAGKIGGQEAVLFFALVETGRPEKLLATSFIEHDTPAKEAEAAVHIIQSLEQAK